MMVHYISSAFVCGGIRVLALAVEAKQAAEQNFRGSQLEGIFAFQA
jgi:hypothetical protein